MNTTQHTMHYSNNSTALWKDGLFGKAVAMALLAILTLATPATLRAQSDPEPATITLTADYNEEAYTVGTPSGYTAYYTTDGTEPTSTPNRVANSQISVADLANGTTITVIAINNSAETTAVATATVERYLAPVAYMTATSSLVVAAIDASTGVRLRYKEGNSGSWTDQSYTDGAYTFSNPTASTEYTFRNYGPETNPEKFPSESVSINTGNYLSFSPDYVAGTITVSVMSATSSATEYEYIYSTTGHPEFAQDEDGQDIAYTSTETLTYTVGAQEDRLYVAARHENTIVRGVYIIQRYATPTAALINYSTTQGTITPNITVTRTDASTDVLRLGYTTSVGSGVNYLDYANGTYTFCNVDDNDNNNFTTHAIYYFRNYGPESGATSFPSKAAEVNTYSYILPAIANYIPVKSRGNTSTPASGYIYTEPGGKIYVNYSHHVNGENSPLLDPNPYDQSTYDVAYTPGDHILLSYATFKMAAGPAVVTVYTGNKLRSAVVTVDTQYCDKDVFCHVDADGTPHYLAISDDNSSVVDVTVFSDKCLWTRDASNNRLYQSRSNRRYYLSRNGSSNSLTAATNVNDAQGKWLKVGAKMCLYTNQTMGLCYNQGWQLSSGTQGDFEVGYRPFHHSVGVSNVYTFHSIDMISPARVGSAGSYHQPYWLAVNADHSHDLWVYARARVNKYTLPPHEYYNFKTGEGQNQVDRHFWLDEYGFGHTSFSELQIGDPTPVYFHSRSAAEGNQHPEMFTFEWSVGSDNANYVTLTTSGTNGSDLNVARNTANALTAPRNIPLQVTVTFNNNDLASEYVDAVQGSGSSDDVVHLLLEQEEANNAIHPIHATDHSDATFQDGHYYLLRNYHVVPQTQTPYYLSGRYRDGQAYIIDTAEPERLFKVQTVTETENGQTRTYYTFENVALTEEHHLQNQTGTWYLTANTTGNTDGNYWYNTPAVAFGSGTNTNDYQFTVKSYKAADGTSYFTLTPKNVTSGASLAPHWNYHQRGTTLRYSNPYSSHLVTIEDGTTNNRQTTIETPDSTAWCLRWQLESPSCVAPVIKVDDHGDVVITDHAGHQRHLGGYLHYQVKAAPTEAVPNPGWGDVQTHTLLASSYAEGCNCTESSVTLPGLAAGAMVRAWKTPTDDLSYFAVSETTEFTVRQVAKPTFHLDGNHITMSCATPGATITYSLTSDFENPATYSVPIHDYETGHVYTIRATAPNMLASDTAVLHYKPMIALNEYQMCTGQTCAQMIVYIDEEESGSHHRRGSHSPQPLVDPQYFNVYYVYDNSTPSEIHGNQAVRLSPQLFASDENDQPIYVTLFEINTENIPIYRAIAIPTEAGSELYRPSNVFMRMSWSQYMTFMDTVAGSRAQFMTTGGPNNTLATTTDLDGRALWIGPSREAHNTNPQLVMNYETSEYLTLRKDVANGTLSLFLDADNTHHNPTDAQYPTSNQWKWSKEPPLDAVVLEGTDTNCRDYPGYYKLSTTLTETRNDVATPVTYYLVYDRTAGIWKAVEGNSSPAQATAPEGCNMQVAYHVTLFDYPGGNEYSVRTLNLYHELPAGSGNWHKLATNSKDGIANTEAWAALSNGESINLRASFDGVYITYAPNRDINIIKPGYENMRDEANYDNYQPLSQWHYYTTTNDDGQEVGHYVRHYSLVAGYTETPMTDYNDNLTHIRWHQGNDTIGVVRDEQTTHTLPAGTLQSYDARFQYTYDDTHPDRITMKCIASGITAPDFSSVLHVTGYNDRVYVNVD